MEKTFQVSFGYLGALMALAAASGLDVSTALANELGIRLVPLFCTAILVLNAVYLSFAAGTWFATIKRTLFLIEHDPAAVGHRSWAAFAWSSDHCSFCSGVLASWAWNLDNLYMLPLFMLIGTVSIAATVVGLNDADRALAQVAVIVAAISHAVPLAMLVVTGKLAAHAAAMARLPVDREIERVS